MTARWTAAATILQAAIATLAAAPAAALDAELDLGLQSAYVWRGMVIEDRPVLQPSLTVSQGGLAGGLWANVNLTAGGGRGGEASEIDVWLAGTVSTAAADWTLTCYSYAYPHSSDPSTQEVWATVTLKALPFGPSLSAIRDVGEIGGWYVLLTGSQSLGLLRTPASEGLVLTLNLGHGTEEYTRGYFPEMAADGVTDYGARLDWPVKIGPGTLTLGVQYTGFATRNGHSAGLGSQRAKASGGLNYVVPL